MLKGNILMEPVLEIETNLLPPEQIPALSFQKPGANQLYPKKIISFNFLTNV